MNGLYCITVTLESGRVIEIVLNATSPQNACALARIEFPRAERVQAEPVF